MLGKSPDEQLDIFISLSVEQIHKIMRYLSSNDIWSLMASSRHLLAIGGWALLERRGADSYKIQQKVLRCWLACPELLQQKLSQIDYFSSCLDDYVHRNDIPHRNRTLAYACRLIYNRRYEQDKSAGKETLQRLMLNAQLNDIESNIIMCVIAKHIKNERLYLSEQSHIINFANNMTENLSVIIKGGWAQVLTVSEQLAMLAKLAYSFDVFSSFLPWLGTDVASKFIDVLLVRWSDLSRGGHLLYLLRCIAPHMANKGELQLGASLVKKIKDASWYENYAGATLEAIAPHFGGNGMAEFVEYLMEISHRVDIRQSVAIPTFKYIVPRLKENSIQITAIDFWVYYQNHYNTSDERDILIQMLGGLPLDLKRIIACTTIKPSTLYAHHSIFLATNKVGIDTLTLLSRKLFQEETNILTDQIIIPYIKSADLEDVNRYTASLIRLTEKGAIEKRIAAVKILGSIVSYLGRNDEKEVLVVIMNALASEEEKIITAALKVVGKQILNLTSKTSINLPPLLISSLDHGDQDVRLTAINASLLYAQHVGVKNASKLIAHLVKISKCGGLKTRMKALGVLATLYKQLNQDQINNMVDGILDRLTIEGDEDERIYGMEILEKISDRIETEKLHVVIFRCLFNNICCERVSMYLSRDSLMGDLLLSLGIEKTHRILLTLLDCANGKFNTYSEVLRKISEDLNLLYENLVPSEEVAILNGLGEHDNESKKERFKIILFKSSNELIEEVVKTISKHIKGMSNQKGIAGLIDTMLEVITTTERNDVGRSARDIVINLSKYISREKYNDLVFHLFKLHYNENAEVYSLLMGVCAQRPIDLNKENLNERLVTLIKSILTDENDRDGRKALLAIWVLEKSLPHLEISAQLEFVPIFLEIIKPYTIDFSFKVRVVGLIIPLSRLLRQKTYVFFGEIYKALLMCLSYDCDKLRETVPAVISYMLFHFRSAEQFQSELDKFLDDASDENQRTSLLKIISPPLTNQMTQGTAANFSKILRERLRDVSKKVKHAAILGLIEIGPSLPPHLLHSLYSTVIKYLSSESIIVREEAANLLSYISSAAGIKTVADRLKKQPGADKIQQVTNIIFSSVNEIEGKVKMAYGSADKALLNQLNDDEIAVPANTLLKIAALDYIDDARVQRLHCRACFEDALQLLKKRKRVARSDLRSQSHFATTAITEFTTKLEEAKSYDKPYLNHLISLVVNKQAYQLDERTRGQLMDSEFVINFLNDLTKILTITRT